MQERSPFEKSLQEWNTQAVKYSDLAKQNQVRITQISQELEKLGKTPLRELPGGFTPKYTQPLGIAGDIALRLSKTAFRNKQSNQLKVEAISTTNLLERNDFYSRLYGQTPILIASGKFITSKDILSNLKTPDDFTPAELEEVNTKLNDMISTVITGRRPLPEMAA